MKVMVGYTIWCKVDMLSWLLEGITRNFDPRWTEVAICFDDCDDGTKEAFDAMRHFWLDSRGYRVHTTVSDQELALVIGTNRIIDIFMNTDCDILLTPQDDQRLNTALAVDLERAINHYGARLGAIGGRVGFREHYQDMVSSIWSAKDSGSKTVLQTGEWAERPYYNDGPVAYPRHLIQKIGKLDERFHGFYVWNDYGARAVNAGLTNLTMGMDVTHMKFGRVKGSPLGGDGMKALADLTLLRTKHGLIM